MSARTTHLESGDYTLGVTSNLAMMVQGNGTPLRTAEDEGITGVVDLLLLRET